MDAATISEAWLSGADIEDGQSPSPVDRLEEFAFMPSGCVFESAITDPSGCDPTTTVCGTVSPCVGTQRVCGC
jgi:hypothetical protein